MVQASVICKRLEVPFRQYEAPSGCLDRIAQAVQAVFYLIVDTLHRAWDFVRCHERIVKVKSPHCSYKAVSVHPKKAITAKDDPYIIISIDGGGVRGKIPATFLQRLEEKLNQKVRSLAERIVGSSAGGIIALALSVPSEKNPDESEYTAQAVNKLFDIFASKVFATSCWHKISSFFGYREAKYGSPRQIIQSLVGETKLAACVSKVSVTSFDLLTANTVLFSNNYDDLEILQKRRFSCIPADRDVAVDFAATATSAAPTFFPSLGRYVDGGIGANSPALLETLRAMSTDAKGRPIFVLSLGTGKTVHEPISVPSNISWGALPWVGPLITYLLDGSQHLVDEQMGLLTDANPNIGYMHVQLQLENDDEAQMDNSSPANLQRLEDLTNKLFDDLMATPDGQKLLSIFKSKINK